MDADHPSTGVNLPRRITELVGRGVPASYGAVWRLLKAEGITVKKSLFAAEQARPDVARRRQRWKKYQGRLDPKRLVFIDETWAKTNMTRRHGRTLRGRRLVAKVPHGRWRTMTFLAALRCDRIAAPCVIDGPINGLSFRAFSLMSSRSGCPPWRPATLSSWTISAVTSARPSAA